MGFGDHLTLKENGKYTITWTGCLGVYGEASGNWTLASDRVAFVSLKETSQMKGHLNALDVVKYKDGWILVPTEKHLREFYDKYGASEYSCFQKQKAK
jgi:hypothetical protein